MRILLAGKRCSIHFREVAVVAALVCAALLWTSGAVALATTVSIGERNFEAVAPQGHVVTGVYHPELKRQLEQALPTGARLVEVYLAKADFDELHRGGVPKLDSVFQLQVLRATENKLLSLDGFAEVADAMEKGFANPPKGTVFVGQRSRKPWGLFYALQLSDAASGNTEVGAALVVVNYQLLQLMYYVDANRRNARSEADEGVFAWAQALRKENPDLPGLGDRAGKLDLGGKALSSDSVAFGVGRALGFAFFIFLMYRIFVRKKD